jgi:3-deoxy-D-manno-octulosonate 8-phosphate phosphatase (KDO 8-P phosphatase)
MSKINFKEDLKKVRAFAFDVDGVLSDPKVFLSSEGELLRTMNTKDGYALQYASNRGYPIAIITGGTTESVGLRFSSLGIRDIYLGASNKLRDFDDFKNKYDLNSDEILFMGDDLPDYEVMKACGVPCCPADAVEEIKSVSVYISHKNGGEGCVRDIIEQVLRLHGRWMDNKAFSW